MGPETFDTVVIGAGQAGLSAGYHLREAGRSFVILDANARVGDNWRERWDSLRLFTPAWSIGLPGWRFPAKGFTTPFKDELADYLEAYAARFALPVRNGVRVDGVRRDGDGFVVTAGDRTFRAANVIVASGAHREARVPAIAGDLDPAIVQLHSTAYKNPSQLREGGVLVVGAGNSGADISLEVSATHPTWLSGPIRGHIPADIDSGFARHVAFRIVRFIGLHVLTMRTPIGRRSRAKSAMQGDPLIRVKPKWLDRAGVRPCREDRRGTGRRPRARGRDGPRRRQRHLVHGVPARPVLDRPADLRRGRQADARTRRRDGEPGLYFVGLPFQYSAGSTCCPAWAGTRSTSSGTSCVEAMTRRSKRKPRELCRPDRTRAGAGGGEHEPATCRSRARGGSESRSTLGYDLRPAPGNWSRYS